MIRDRIVVTMPTRVHIEVDRDDLTVRRGSVVDEMVAEFWVPEGAEMDLPAWVKNGVEQGGWKVTRQPAAHVVPEVDGDVGSPNWRGVADHMARLVRDGGVREALDVHEIATLQQDMVDEPPTHPHLFPGEPGVEPEPDTECSFPGCRLRYAERP